MRNSLVLLLVALVVSSVIGCAAEQKRLPGVEIAPEVEFAPLARSEYKILGTVKAEGCAAMTALWPLPIWWVSPDESISGQSSSQGGGFAFGIDVTGPARAVATYRALNQIPQADALLAPRYYEDINNGIWHYKVCSTVSARSITIIPDSGEKDEFYTEGKKRDRGERKHRVKKPRRSRRPAYDDVEEEDLGYDDDY